MKKPNNLILFSLFCLALFISILFKGAAMADGFMPPVSDALYKKECGACHWAFLPGLLPERSWIKIMDGLEKHFGDDASLEPTDVERLKKYLANNAADRVNAKRSGKILKSIRSGQTPIKVTETPYIIKKHREINAKIYQRKEIRTFSNCAACHPGANRGSFSDDDVRIPGTGGASEGRPSFAPPNISMSKAIDIATSRQPGQVVEAELERGLYEIKLITPEGARKKIFVDPKDGSIVHKKNFSLEKAKAAAQKETPGEIVKVEFEGGYYEFKIKTPEGSVKEVYVNARDGKVMKSGSRENHHR